MTSADSAAVSIRPAAAGDISAIIAIAMATGQDEDWDEVYPNYVRHMMTHGSFLVAEQSGSVSGCGAILQIGTGADAISMLTDLFVDPAAHGTGTGRTLLGALWTGKRRMTFSSLHANALPLYTSFGVDAWWPLLYLRGDVRRLPRPAGWTVTSSSSEEVASLERGWTGVDRTADHRFWADWPDGSAVVASLDGRPAAAGTTGGAGPEFGICHLSADPGTAGEVAADGVLAVLSRLEPPDGVARVCLPAPHRATRPLLRAGW